MMELIANNMAPIMFAGLIFFLLLGFPVTFSLGACGLFFGFVGIELGLLPEALLQALPNPKVPPLDFWLSVFQPLSLLKAMPHYQGHSGLGSA